ncbi:hypothetical protein KUTeg_011723 [Tegillarca granosa]|uniref:S-formylglutathione hydrolase n=1 Tax=Tegillarca granosa TaxID=220873 RepID=A0ABQ9EXI0_TEGGR|nr:hypothetical protein KUTeg_011723 [Tegillarca granosa]
MLLLICMFQEYDACCLVKKYNGPPLDILIDQGKADNFLAEQLYPDNFVQACAEGKTTVTLRKQEDYDHSYFFIATFVEDHLNHLAKYLK